MEAAHRTVFLMQQPALMEDRHKQRAWGQLAQACPSLSVWLSADHLLCPSMAVHLPSGSLPPLAVSLLAMLLTLPFPGLIPTGSQLTCLVQGAPTGS